MFNTLGYRLWISYAVEKSDNALEARLDKGNYREDELIVVKAPIDLPYQTNWKEFERVDGEISVKGTVYKYVKRKIYNDTMVYMCIPHREKSKIMAKSNDYFGKVNSLPGDENNSKKAEVIKQLLSDFVFNEQQVVSYSFSRSTSFGLHINAICLHQYIPLHGQPPDSIV